jgi:Zn-dependent M28 family amino/carboxypeptidase
MACLSLFVPGLLQLHQYKNPNNKNKILARTTSPSSPNCSHLTPENIKEHNQHIVANKTSFNNQQSKANHFTKDLWSLQNIFKRKPIYLT